MLAKRIIPCLDVDHGRVVKGTNFVNLKDAGDPVAVAARYDLEGADELVFLDITASHEGRAILLDVVRRTAEVCFMPLTVGGGIRSLDDIRTLLNAGADKVSINFRRPCATLEARAAGRPGSSAVSASWSISIPNGSIAMERRSVGGGSYQRRSSCHRARGARLGPRGRAPWRWRDRPHEHGRRRDSGQTTAMIWK